MRAWQCEGGWAEARGGMDGGCGELTDVREEQGLSFKVYEHSGILLASMKHFLDFVIS